MEEQIQSLRQAMAVLDQDPEELMPPRSLDPELIHQYEETVMTYLERKSLETFLNTVIDDPELSRLQEETTDTAVFEETRQATDRLLSLVKTIDDASINLQSSLAVARSKRDAFENLVMEAQTNNGRSVMTMMTQVDDSEDDDAEIDIVEIERRSDELDAEKERLQRRKAELLHQIQAKESENDRVEKETTLFRQKIDLLRERVPNIDVDGMLQDPSKLDELQKENQERAEHINELKATEEHFEYMKSLMENLSGVRVLKLERSANNSEGGELHLARFQLLGKYDIEMQTEISVAGHLNVLTASFVPECPVLRSQADEHGNYIQLTAAPLQNAADAMNLIPWKTTEERLNYFFLETVNMLSALEQRASDLFKLSQDLDVLIKIPPIQVNGDQEIVCSMTNLQLSFSLHLTGDCPLTSPSVFIKQFAGFGGWKEEILQHLSTFLQSQDFASPLALVNALKGEVKRLEEQEGLQIPETPRFSLQKKHDWG